MSDISVHNDTDLLKDIYTLLRSMESNLNEQLQGLSAQLEDSHRTMAFASAIKRQVKPNCNAQIMTPEVEPSKLCNTSQAIAGDHIDNKSKDTHGPNQARTNKHVKISSETQQQQVEVDDKMLVRQSEIMSSKVGHVAAGDNFASDHGQADANFAVHGKQADPQRSPSLRTIASANKAVLPSDLEKHSNTVEPVWKRFGSKPSEAAQTFLRDALTKAQKRKIMRSADLRPIEEDPQTPENLEALPGIDVVLDLKQGGTGNFTETVSGWWKAGSYDNPVVNAAMKQVDSMKHSVYDLLLSKGWVVPEPVLSQRKAEKQTMSKAARFVSSTTFEFWCCLIILLNAVMLGYTTQFKADPVNDDDSISWQFPVQVIFTSWFAFEVLVRMYAWRIQFFVSKDWSWNVFDLSVVIISVIEIALDAGSDNESATNFGIVRVIRILRLVRAIRFIRVVRFFAELRMMIYSSLRSVKPFCWALGILLIMIYVFAIVTTQVVSDYRRDNAGDDLQKMLHFFGSLWKSVYTLFMIISGGVSWAEPAEELQKVHWSWTCWMSLYVAFVMFAVLNIVTGIFIESALKSAQDDQDVVIQEEMNHEDGLAQGFLEVFQRVDHDKSGYIDAEEFNTHLSDSRVRAFLHHLGLDIQEAHGLFRLLDIGGTGRVYAKEFVMGCQQLKGPAKNVDVATLLFQNKRMMTLWAVFMSFVEDQFALLIGQSNDKDESSIAHLSQIGSLSQSQRLSVTI